MSGFNVVVDPVVTDLSIDESSKTWPASAFSLVVACFLLPFGKLADMYGGRIMHLGGLLWVTVWSIVAGVSRNELMLDFSRALQGLGAAAFLPSGLMLMGKVFRPGPRKNKVGRSGCSLEIPC